MHLRQSHTTWKDRDGHSWLKRHPMCLLKNNLLKALRAQPILNCTQSLLCVDLLTTSARLRTSIPKDMGKARDVTHVEKQVADHRATHSEFSVCVGEQSVANFEQSEELGDVNTLRKWKQSAAELRKMKRFRNQVRHPPARVAILLEAQDLKSEQPHI
eukprot:96727-Amphidinium_carterae.1